MRWVGIAARWIWKQVTALLADARKTIVALANAEGRRGWAVVLGGGGGMAMTLYAMRAQWFVRMDPNKSFWLGAIALMIVLVVVTGFMGLLVKRRVSGNVRGIAEFEVTDDTESEVDVLPPTGPSVPKQ